MSAINEQTLIDQIDAIKSELASCQKALEGSAANRSNPAEWYKERIEHLNEKLREYQGQLQSGNIPESSNTPAGFAELQAIVNSLAARVEFLESSFGACKTRLEAVEAAAIKPVDPAPGS